MARLLLVVATAVTALGVWATPAAATFPGANGEVVYLWSKAYHDEFNWMRLVRLDPRGKGRSEQIVCEFYRRLAGSRPQDCYQWRSDPAGSPDGRRLAFTSWPEWLPDGRDRSSDDPASDEGVRILGEDGKEIAHVSLPPDGPTNVVYRRLRWSPDGLRFLVERLVSTDDDYVSSGLLSVSIDGTDVSVIDPLGSDGDWSAQGKIAYIRAGDLYLSEPGAVARRLTWRGAAHPSWSPDGSRIAFNRGPCGWAHEENERGCGVYVVPAVGGKARLLYRRAIEPVWSPDGTQIAFIRMRWLGPDLDRFDPAVMTVDVRTHRVRMLTKHVLLRSGLEWISGPEWLVRR